MLWLDFDAWKHHCVMPVYFTVRTGLANASSYTFSFYHIVLTGCDTPSDFAGRGKKTAWDTWNITTT